MPIVRTRSAWRARLPRPDSTVQNSEKPGVAPATTRTASTSVTLTARGIRVSLAGQSAPGSRGRVFTTVYTGTPGSEVAAEDEGQAVGVEGARGEEEDDRAGHERRSRGIRFLPAREGRRRAQERGHCDVPALEVTAGHVHGQSVDHDRVEDQRDNGGRGEREEERGAPGLVPPEEVEEQGDDSGGEAEDEEDEEGLGGDRVEPAEPRPEGGEREEVGVPEAKHGEHRGEGAGHVLPGRVGVGDRHEGKRGVAQ